MINTRPADLKFDIQARTLATLCESACLLFVSRRPDRRSCFLHSVWFPCCSFTLVGSFSHLRAVSHFQRATPIRRPPRVQRADHGAADDSNRLVDDQEEWISPLLCLLCGPFELNMTSKQTLCRRGSLPN